MVEKIKKAIEPFYTDVCSVYEKRAVNTGGRTEFEETVIYENIPCRISIKSYLFGEKAAEEKENLLEVNKRAKIFLPPEYYINPGSRIKVRTKNRETVYAKSGMMSCYTSHNEVMAELVKNYA